MNEKGIYRVAVRKTLRAPELMFHVYAEFSTSAVTKIKRHLRQMGMNPATLHVQCKKVVQMAELYQNPAYIQEAWELADAFGEADSKEAMTRLGRELYQKPESEWVDAEKALRDALSSM